MHWSVVSYYADGNIIRDSVQGSPGSLVAEKVARRHALRQLAVGGVIDVLLRLYGDDGRMLQEERVYPLPTEEDEG